MKPPVFRRMFDYDRALLPNRRLAELETGVTTIDEARARSGASIGYPGWGLLYHILLSHLDRGREEILIETGTNQGATTIVLAQALIDAGCAGRVLTFELEESNADIAENNYALAGVSSRIVMHRGDVRKTFPSAIAGVSGLRFAFLDASHLEKDVIFEFTTLLPHLADDGLVVFDNTYCIANGNEDQRVNGALKKIQSEYGGNLINFENVSWFTPGLAIWQKAPKL